MNSLRQKNVTKMDNAYVVQQEKKAEKVQKRKRGLRRRLMLYAVCATIFAIFAVATLTSQYGMLGEKAQQKEQAQSHLAQLENDEKLLKDEIVKLNDDEYVAKLVRRDYFLSEEGEIIFNIPKAEEQRD